MNHKLNILFLSSWYPSRILPLNGDFIQRHAEAVTLMHHVTVIHVITDKNAKEKIEISDKNINGVRTIIAYIQPSKIKIFRFIKAFKILLKITGKVDVVHVNKLFPAGIIALYLKHRDKINYLISEHHHIYYTPFNQKIKFVEKLISKIITKNASFVCPVTNDLGKAMQSFGLKGNYQKVPNVIFTDIFTPKRKKNKSTFTLLHVSGVSEIKNIEGILKTIAKLQQYSNDFVFYMIGKEINQYKALAESLSIESNKIVFIDQLTQKELANYYKKADVFVLFSQIETFSIVIYEAFSSGTPVISSDIDAIRENFPNEFGLLVERGNTQQLLEGILRIKEGLIKADPDEMHNYVEKNFSSKSIAKAFDKLYQKSKKSP